MSINSTTGAASAAASPSLASLATVYSAGSAGSAAASAAAASTATDSSASLNQTFLTMLVAQLNNQDPLNPMDSSQMTSQMAQIDTVSGISSLNSSISSLLTQFQQLETMQAAQLSGRSVLVSGSDLTLANAGATSGGASGAATAQGAIQLAASADAVTVQVKDASGTVVRTMNLGSEPAGMQRFTWDGKTDAGASAAAGSYTYAVKATAAGNAVQTTAYSAQQVTGASADASGAVQLSLANGSQVPYSAVKQFL